MDMGRLEPRPGDRSRTAIGAISGAADLLPLALLLITLGGTANAQTNLVQNGNFAVTGGTTSFQFGTFDGYTPAETLADWSSTGYNFVFLPTSTSANSAYGTGNLTLYSSTTTPSNSFNNASPTGGNFIAADADYGTEPIHANHQRPDAGRDICRVIRLGGRPANRLHRRDDRTMAGQSGQQRGDHAEHQDRRPTRATGFTGWMDQTFDFVATSSSEVLSFLANGTPAGVPPFALLANVSMTQVPEPGSLMVLLSGITGLIGLG